MSKHIEWLSEKTTHLAEKRTELAYERTIMSYIRTGATVILFGIAFLGMSPEKGDFLYWAGIISVIVGLFIMLFAFKRAIKHSKEIRKVKKFFEKIKYKFKHH